MTHAKKVFSFIIRGKITMTLNTNNNKKTACLKYPSISLAYADIEIQLDVLFKKSADLFYRGHYLAGNEVKGLVFDLKDLNRWYFKEKRMDYDDYQSEALYIIQKARPVLEEHRGYKKLLGNLAILILTLGTAFIVNKALNGRYLFFQKTESAKQLDKISRTLDSVRDLLPPPVRLQTIKGRI